MGKVYVGGSPEGDCEQCEKCGHAEDCEEASA